MHLVAVDADIIDARVGVAHQGEACRNELPGVEFVISADREFLDVDLVAHLHDFLHRAVLDHDRFYRVRFACCKLGQEGFLVTFLHADGIAQPREAAMHVGDQRVFTDPLTFSKMTALK